MFVSEIGDWLALATVRVSVIVPWKFASTTVTVTEYVPAFTGAQDDWYVFPFVPL